MIGGHLFVMAGEASGDQLGAGLMEAVRRLSGDTVRFSGIGGTLMEAQGLVSLFPQKELAVMGFAELLPHLPRLLRRIHETVLAIEAAQPDAVVSIDAPGFMFRVARKLKQRGRVRCPLIHYVAPTVWAYKPKRAQKTARLFDHLLVLLPFEPPYFEKEGLATTFIGHPVLDDLEERFARRQTQPPRPPERLHLCLLAGSRAGEIARLLPVYRQAVEQLAPSFSDFRLILPATPDTLPLLRQATQGWPWPMEFPTGPAERYEAFYRSDFAIAKSGTVTLEIAKTGLPMIVTYKVNPLSARLLKPLLLTQFFNLINIIHGRAVIPELIQDDCTPERLTATVQSLLASPPAMRQQTAEALEAMRQMQAPGGETASGLAARTVLGLMARA